MAKISVIIPCYNHGRYIVETIQSVLAQTYGDFEIIVVDDGSQDPDTIRKLDESKWPRTRVFRKENGGPSAARNFGIERATGSYILPLDADDLIGPTYLEKAIACMENDSDLGIVYCRANFFGAIEASWEIPEYSFPEILLRNVIMVCALFRKADWQRVGGFKEDMVSGWEDYDFWLYILRLGRKVYRIPETLFFYRQLGNSRSQKMSLADQFECHRTIFRHHEPIYRDNTEYLFDLMLKSVRQGALLRRLGYDDIFAELHLGMEGSFRSIRLPINLDESKLVFSLKGLDLSGVRSIEICPLNGSGVIRYKGASLVHADEAINLAIKGSNALEIRGEEFVFRTNGRLYFDFPVEIEVADKIEVFIEFVYLGENSINRIIRATFKQIPKRILIRVHNLIRRSLSGIRDSYGFLKRGKEN